MATILIVDDEVGIRELLSEILSEEGHRVDVAENAQQARDYRLRQAPDLILLDIWMPDTDGVTLLKEWARQGQLTMPVIMMSGHATINTAVEATRIGALNFLEKPITLQKLLRAVEQGLARRNLISNTTSNTANTLQDGKPKTAISSQQPGALPNAVDTACESADTPLQPTQTTAISFDIPLRDARDAFERAYFKYHLMHENSMKRIAEKTGLERTHLYRKLKQLGVELTKNKLE